MKFQKTKAIKFLCTLLIFVLMATMLPLTPAVAASQEEQVENFVERLYSILLGREVEAEGREYWTNVLISGADNGANVASGIVFSDELIARRLSNEQFVECMYLTVFDREADEHGKNYWLDTNYSRRTYQYAKQ